MADAKTSASVVAIDTKSAAELRDRLAREQLDKANHQHDRETLAISGVTFTMPWTLKVCVQGFDEGANVNTGIQKRNEYKVALEKIVQEGFAICNRHLNEFEPTSEVSEINSCKVVGQVFKLSDHLFNILQIASRTSRATGGAFDLGYVNLLEYLKGIAIRNGGRLDGHLTDAEKREAEKIATELSFENAFDFNEQNKTIAKKKAVGRMGINAIAKGYTVDLVVELLNKNGYNCVLFEWAGDIRASGSNEQNKPWSVGVICPPSIEDVEKGRKPHLDSNTRKYLRTCYLQDAAIATSGDYEYQLTPGSRVTSLVLMKNASLIEMSDDSLAQVSVTSTSCAVADALSTTLLLKRSISNARWWLQQWRSVRNPILDFTFYVRQGEVVARKHEVALEAPEVRAARIRDNLPARVIIVGGGLAGLSAAIEAASCNASVIIMEKTSSLGGNSAKATSGINGWGTRMQGALDIEDDGRFFERDTFLSGKGGVVDVNLVKTLSLRSSDAIHWLQSQTQLDLSVVSQLGGHSKRRTHRIPDTPNGEPVPVGYTIMSRLRARIERDFSEKITIMKDTTVTGLVNEASVGEDHIRRVRVTGVKYKNTSEVGLASATEDSLLADAVILATGGFSNDHTATSLLAEYAPELEKVPTTNGPFATGDGVKMAREIGATLLDMDKIQLHPTGFIDPKNPTNPTKYLGPEALRGSGGILVAPNGQRFVNELGLRSHVSAAIKALGNNFPESNGLPFAYCVLNKHASKLFGPAQLSFYRDKVGLFKSAKNHEELAALIGCDVATIKKTLTDYAAAVRAGRCPQTGKSVFPCPWSSATVADSNDDDGPYEVSVITPCIHYTMGGVAISPAAEVQIVDTSDSARLGRSRPVRGLFAAGEVSSGVHGANRLGGNSLLECVVFGRIAGDRAASILQRHTHGALNAHSWTWTTVREIREGTEFGRGARIIRFNFPGSMQPSGLHVGQFVAIRGEWEGKNLLGYYSPMTLPNDIGVIGLLVRIDKGPLREWLAALQPGHAVEMKAGGGLAIDRHLSERCFIFEQMKIRKLGLVAGGTGVAPMLQIIRAALKAPIRDGISGIRLVYASETFEELTYEGVLKRYAAESNGLFSYTVVLNNPPAGWTGGVGFVDTNVLRSTLFPPSEDHLIVLCGPPVMQRIVKGVCVRVLKHNPKLVRTVDEQPKPISKQ